MEEKLEGLYQKCNFTLPAFGAPLMHLPLLPRSNTPSSLLRPPIQALAHTSSDSDSSASETISLKPSTAPGANKLLQTLPPPPLSNLKPKHNTLSAKTKACDSSVAKTRAVLRTRNGGGAGYLEPKHHDARGGVAVMLLRQKRKRQEGNDGTTPRHKLVPAFRVHRSQQERLKKLPRSFRKRQESYYRELFKTMLIRIGLEGPRSSSALPCPAQRERERERDCKDKGDGSIKGRGLSQGTKEWERESRMVSW